MTSLFLLAQTSSSFLEYLPPLELISTHSKSLLTETRYSLGASDRTSLNIFPVKEFT
ncbi:MAG: hypothetical protein ACTMUB_05660 [cyanobacterium endosymbiont of Rhopalodia musculus]|uniref:hypothetical protein n=1 Tax=cyanobacterium endosymbiont of Epithemia clementina EcSB TaxID=3034674 RepID=UPI0024808D16|nr:hypothetical protein [cyanobacterium endosymbiont of Epithemia clementina EcSB]WGT67630.1 hypothetical protein P3F56_00520 [cyanobacterium endosymbiont of Epithemia clementina EcSB]